MLNIEGVPNHLVQIIPGLFVYPGDYIYRVTYNVINYDNPYLLDRIDSYSFKEFLTYGECEQWIQANRSITYYKLKIRNIYTGDILRVSSNYNVSKHGYFSSSSSEEYEDEYMLLSLDPIDINIGSTKRQAPDGNMYTRKEFEVFFGGIDEWEEAGKAAEEETEKEKEAGKDKKETREEKEDKKETREEKEEEEE